MELDEKKFDQLMSAIMAQPAPTTVDNTKVLVWVGGIALSVVGFLLTTLLAVVAFFVVRQIDGIENNPQEIALLKAEVTSLRTSVDAFAIKLENGTQNRFDSDDGGDLKEHSDKADAEIRSWVKGELEEVQDRFKIGNEFMAAEERRYYDQEGRLKALEKSRD